uniref:Uncharacterized protein n=1 Tax=Lotharella globosa TaxID=91324 RepID=A0A7S3YT21_9EUKA
MGSKEVAHHAASATVIALAIPFGPCRMLSLAARATWMGWSALSMRDLQVAKRRRLAALAEDESARKSSTKALGSTLLDLHRGYTEEGSWTNIHDATFMWEESQQDRLKGVGTRAALMQCRLRQGFDESAEGYYKQRIEKHYSSKAINLKAVLSGLTFGVVPHVLSWNLPGLRDGHRKLDSALFGQVSPKPVSGLDPGIAEAVLRGTHACVTSNCAREGAGGARGSE